MFSEVTYRLSFICLIGLFSLSSLCSELYRWRDANGVVHISDKPPKDKTFETLVEQQLLEAGAQHIVWQPVTKITIAKASPATKGGNRQSVKKQQCDKLRQKIKTYTERLTKPGDHQKLREQRRKLLWQKHNEC